MTEPQVTPPSIRALVRRVVLENCFEMQGRGLDQESIGSGWPDFGSGVEISSGYFNKMPTKNIFRRFWLGEKFYGEFGSFWGPSINIGHWKSSIVSRLKCLASNRNLPLLNRTGGLVDPNGNHVVLYKHIWFYNSANSRLLLLIYEKINPIPVGIFGCHSGVGAESTPLS